MATINRPTITLVFRGLIVFHKREGYYDVGILKVPGHSFTINVRSDSSRGKKQTALSMNLTEAPPERWQLSIADPLEPGIREYSGQPFDRSKEDFRWIIDLESDEFHASARGPQAHRTVNTLLNPVLRIPHGEFYTRAKSRLLERSRGQSEFEFFGQVAEEIGVDIDLKSGAAVLEVEGKGEEIFKLEKDGDATYEVTIENSPDPRGGHIHPGQGPVLQDHPGGGPPLPEPGPDPRDHFRFYYDFFPEPDRERFRFRHFVQAGTLFAPPPIPDPFICPVTKIGR